MIAVNHCWSEGEEIWADWDLQKSMEEILLKIYILWQWIPRNLVWNFFSILKASEIMKQLNGMIGRWSHRIISEEKWSRRWEISPKCNTKIWISANNQRERKLSWLIIYQKWSDYLIRSCYHFILGKRASKIDCKN